MSFTDDDLKRLKFALENPAPNWVDKDNLAGLIARLEAAEKVCIEARYCQEEKFFSDELSDYYHQWRKAAGR